MAPFLKEVVTAEPASFELFRTAIRRALHLEMRDGYPPDDPDWLEWKAGGRFDPAERWRVGAISCGRQPDAVSRFVVHGSCRSR